MLKLSQFHNNGLKRDYYLVNFTSHPIFAVHSKNGIGLPDSIMVVRLFLVQFVLVRIQVGQPKKKKPQRKLWFFYTRDAASETSIKQRIGKYELARYLTRLRFKKLRSNLQSRV